jgi:hypothetical protein
VIPTQRNALVRAAWGGALLLGPHIVLVAVGRSQAASVARASVVLRILGARHLAQAALELRRPTADVCTPGAVADALHAGSAIALAACDRTWRRAALLDSTVATGFAIATARTARHHPSREQLRRRR